MPLPTLLSPDRVPELDKSTGGMSPGEILFEINRGARFVRYQYVISLIVVTIRRGSSLVFVKAGESAAMRSLPYTLLTLFLGWWGFPFGLIRTPIAIYKNLSGGEDFTDIARTLCTPKEIRSMQDLA